jgi:hypothetical protein
MKKTFKLDKFIASIDVRRKFKQIGDGVVLTTLFTGLTIGATSLNAIVKHHEKVNNGETLSRSVLEDFLKLEGLPKKIRQQIKIMIHAMQRGKMIHLENVQGKNLGAIDGIEVFRKDYTPEDFYNAVLKGNICKLCLVSVHKNKITGEIERYSVYHRMVVISIITNRGPIPIAWKFQQSDTAEKYSNWIKNGCTKEKRPDNDSEEKVKQDGELTVLTEIFAELKQIYGKIPFQLLIGDSLYDKAPVADFVESFGVALIANHKDERRNTRKEAAEEFSFRNPDSTWTEGKVTYQAWSQIVEDPNRADKKHNTVKIIRVKRLNPDGSCVDNYFYCSKFKFIQPRLVENCRFYRWKEENGFNAWTNQWNLSKHMFHHNATACDSIIGLIFIMIIAFENYRFGNCCRGDAPRAPLWSFNIWIKELYAGAKIVMRSTLFWLRNFWLVEIGPNTG